MSSLEKCKEYGQKVLEKCNKSRKKCWKSVIFSLSIVWFTYFFVYLQPKSNILYQGNLEAVGNVVYLPIYMVMFIQHNTQRTGNDTYKFDLTGLA